MADRTILITGGTSGIGRAAALALAVPAHRLLVAGRNPVLLEGLARELRSRGAGGVVTFAADLMLMSGVRALAAQVRAATPRLDVLANNAGAIFDTRQLTAEGFERTLALNHLAYVLLTQLLLDRVASSPDGRIVNTASAAHRRARLDLDDLQSGRHYRGWRAYGNSKLMNILFTRALARRLTADPATAHVSAAAFHPGFVASRFGDANRLLFKAAIGVGKWFARTEEQGADTLVWLATAPGAGERSGGYFHERRPGRLSRAAREDRGGEGLWEETERLLARGSS